jgi:hypothetical protein
MHRLSASFVLCYHGCRKDVAESLIGGADFKPSDNDYDWLGPASISGKRTRAVAFSL